MGISLFTRWFYTETCTELNSVVQQPMRAKVYCAYLSECELRHWGASADVLGCRLVIIVADLVHSTEANGHGKLEVKVTKSGPECHEFEPSTAPDLTCRGEKPVKSVEAQTSSSWCGVEVRRGRCKIRCRPHQLTIVCTYEVCRQKPTSNLIVRR
ncbi:hypothetical protein TNCV_3921511 [Trichonephila clavipes]|nr:hypothetical protein TNCV_3921511 [Trichonephila clavipes]